MPNYQYKAINAEGSTIQSVLMAPDVAEVKRQLQGMKMVVISISEVKSAKKADQFKVNVKESMILHFTKQLYTLLKAGVPIITSLRALKDQTPDEGFQQVIGTSIRILKVVVNSRMPWPSFLKYFQLSILIRLGLGK